MKSEKHKCTTKPQRKPEAVKDTLTVSSQC